MLVRHFAAARSVFSFARYLPLHDVTVASDDTVDVDTWDDVHKFSLS